jgi:hypothetical protein
MQEVLIYKIWFKSPRIKFGAFYQKLKKEVKMSEEDCEMWGRSKRKRELIKKVLGQANAIQLLAVSQYVRRYNAIYGYDSIYDLKERAEKAFERKKFDDPDLADLIVEGELVEILQHPERAIEICREVKKNSIT